MDCPGCGAALVAVERREVEVDWCPACRGAWFDGGELALAAQALGGGRTLDLASLPAASSVEKRRRCPRCNGRMEKVEPAPAVLVDRCPAGDGFWLDPGELGHVLAAGEGCRELKFLGETLKQGRST